MDTRSRYRIFTLKILLFTSIFAYLGYTFYIQIIEGVLYRQSAQRFITTDRIIPARRGNIYDQAGVPLVNSQLFFQIAVVPALQSKRQLEILHTMFPKSWEEISITLEKNKDSFALVPIIDGVSNKELFQLAEQVEDSGSIQWYPQLKRNYPAIGSISHVVGHVGSISSTEYQLRVNEGYVQSSNVGKFGVEVVYESVLRGLDGQIRGSVDATGRLIENFGDVRNAVAGSDIYLTIDLAIQELAEAALGERMGAVVVLDPKDSAILAMTSFPSYDPNVLLGVGADNVFAKIEKDPRAPFLNRAIQTAVAPASTFKIVTSFALLQQENFSPYSTVHCDGEFHLGNRVFHCWNKAGHGAENLFDALADSCNVYFYTMANRFLTGDDIAAVALDLGFGMKTGIDLAGEELGLVPTSQWKEQYFNESWQGGDTVNMAIGQGYLTVTPIQLAMLLTRVMNKGKAYQPHLLKEVRDSNTNEIIEHYTPTLLPESKIPEEHWELMQGMLRSVVTRGTVRSAITTNAVSIAGKTGTGQVGNSVEGYTSWFAAYAPHTGAGYDREIVVVVMVDSTNEWEWWAPKAANLIFHGVFTESNFDETIAALRR